jgi:hypothetical protein
MLSGSIVGSRFATLGISAPPRFVFHATTRGRLGTCSTTLRSVVEKRRPQLSHWRRRRTELFGRGRESITFVGPEHAGQSMPVTLAPRRYI